MKCSVSKALSTIGHTGAKKVTSQKVKIRNCCSRNPQKEESECEEETNGALTQVIRKFAREEKVRNITLQVEYDDK